MSVPEREKEAEVEASASAERAVAAILGRPLGLIAGVAGLGVGFAALAARQWILATAWIGVGTWGLATWAVGRELARGEQVTADPDGGPG